LLQAHVLAPRRHGFTEFLKGLHLMFVSKNVSIRPYFDLNINL
jgi:hypothetical protein